MTEITRSNTSLIGFKNHRIFGATVYDENRSNFRQQNQWVISVKPQRVTNRVIRVWRSGGPASVT